MDIMILFKGSSLTTAVKVFITMDSRPTLDEHQPSQEQILTDNYQQTQMFCSQFKMR